MGRLIYGAISSLDGFVADADGDFGWAMPSEEVVAATVELDEPVGTHLYGRRMYELMTGWENDPDAAAQSEQSGAFARSWQRLEKVVYSTTLEQVTTTRTRLERTFDPERVRHEVETSATDVSIAGPTLASAALRAGVVHELQLYLLPVVLGAGLPALPADLGLDLRLREVRRFADGTVLLRHDIATSGRLGTR